jgi:hypothetical protein
MVLRPVEPPKRLDVSASDCAFALRRSALSSERERAHEERELERLWGGGALSALSVR